MIGILRAEWIKLTTLRSHFTLTIIAIAFPIVVVTLTGASTDERFTSHELADLVVGTTFVTGLLIGIVSVVSVTGEFSYNTLRPMFAAAPSRPGVMVTKALLNAVTAAFAVGATVAVCWLVGNSLIDGERSLSDDGVRGALVRMVVFAVIFAFIGVGAGALLRNTGLTVTLLLVWPLVGELLLAQLFVSMGIPSAAKWLPMLNGQIMLFDIDVSDEVDLLRPNQAGVYFAVFAVVLFLFGLLRTSRSDA